MLIPRIATETISRFLSGFPAVGIIGSRQCGKSTLAKELLQLGDEMIYVDLQDPYERAKLSDPLLFFDQYQHKIICLDEIQRAPDLFSLLRSIIDRKKRNGQFIILGSASRDLLRQSSESLSGRIAYYELTPFLWKEVKDFASFNNYLIKGGYPRSLLTNDLFLSNEWRKNFLTTLLERDIPQLGFSIDAENLRRTISMLSHYHGQVFNQSEIGKSLGVSHTTVRNYINVLEKNYMIRILNPFYTNIRKRLVKSPKVYFRDHGILNHLLGIGNYEDLLGQPKAGSIWEGIIIENLTSLLRDFEPYFFRSATGDEIDLILTKGNRKIGIECKFSKSPDINKGFWKSYKLTGLDAAYIIAPINAKDIYPVGQNVWVGSLDEVTKKLMEGIS